MKPKNYISIEKLRAEISYDPETGILRWLSDTANRRRRTGEPCGSMCKDGYLRVSVGGGSLSCHRAGWAIYYGEWPAGQLDHINRIRSDNRITNLREATSHQNAINKGIRSGNKYGLKGVTKLPSGSWQAQAKVNGNAKYLGSYSTKEEAHAVYADYMRQNAGAFIGELSVSQGEKA